MTHATKKAKTLVTGGYSSNGCGNRRWNTLLGDVFQWWAKVDFSPACLYHDAEYSVEECSEEHRLEADKNFLLNLQTCCSKIKLKKYQTRAYKVAKLFHYIVVLNSHVTYYETKKNLIMEESK